MLHRQSPPQKQKILGLIGSICLILVLAALLLPGCAKEAAPTPAAPTPAAPVAPAPAAPAPAAPAVYKMPDPICISTAGTGGTGYFMSTGIAPSMEQRFSVRARVIPAESGLERNEEMISGGAQLGVISWDNVMWSVMSKGMAIHRPPAQFRQLWSLSIQQFGFMVRGDSDIKSIQDIKGRKVCKGVHTPMAMGYADMLVAFAGLSPEDVDFVEVSGWKAVHKAISEGKAEVGIIGCEAAVAYEAAACPQGIRVLDIPHEDKEGWARLNKVMPMMFPFVIDRGVEVGIGHEGAASLKVLMCMAREDEEFAYEMVKYADEDYDKYKDAHISLSMSTRDLQRTTMSIFAFPYHPGAIRYFKEIGIWTAEADKRQENWLILEAQYQAAWEQATRKAKEEGIEIAYDNKEWVELISGLHSKLEGFSIAPLE